MARTQRRTALFYDAPLSSPEDVSLLKSMLLFFDDVAVFSTPAPASRFPPVDPRLSDPLVERRLLQFVAPRDVTRSQTEVIVRAALHRAAVENAEQWLAAAAAGDWDFDVPRLQGRFPGTELLRMSDVTSDARRDPGSLQLLKFLAQDGLLLPDDSTNDEWIVMPGVASVANSILAQAIRTTASAEGWSIEPVATRRDEGKVFTAILEDAVENVGAADVVTSDLLVVTPDLSHVNLDDILEFRARHRSELRAYVLALQALLRSTSTSATLADRVATLADEAGRLRDLQRRRWPNLGAGVSLGIVGAAWTLASGDLLGALIGAAGSQLLPVGPTPVAAYTFIVRADPEPDDSSYWEGRMLGPGS